MERLTVVDEAKKTDAIEERNFKNSTTSKNIHQDNLAKIRTGQYNLKPFLTSRTPE